jgi:hypothetical protein
LKGLQFLKSIKKQTRKDKIQIQDIGKIGTLAGIKDAVI